MRRFLPGPGLRGSVSLALLAVGRALRHQFNAGPAAQGRRLLHAAALAISILALQLPAAAESHRYDVITEDVPFQFYVGDRSFRPGQYEFIIVGKGLLAVRDARKHFIASLVTRLTEADGPAAENKLVFTHRKKRPYLTEIFIENRKQVMEVQGEELAIVPARPAFQPDPDFLPRAGTFNFTDRRDGARLHY